ncbi:hypothetical protein Pla175_03180 [Pirellulimonas nuda]|uniref:Uncharacterized protein n=2 Tax=Pirellulimonas nuda TaxID=2528009 RepID=A0A518D667_9BACT|nr:hypothetical protein Pla175_03180 [Pirellulimonas nuda]
MLSADLRLLADVETRTQSSNPVGYWELGDQAVFFADDGGGYDLYVSDGTDAGTQAIKQLDASILITVSGVTAGDLLYLSFAAQLWRTDGTAAGTFSLTAGMPDPTLRPQNLTAVGSRLFFTANEDDLEDSGRHGEELWVSDGTVAGTALVKDITPGVYSSQLEDFVVAGEQLVFTNDKDQVWISDGTEAGTVLVRDFDPAAHPDLQPAAVRDGYGYVAFGSELWKFSLESGSAELAIDLASQGGGPVDGLTAASGSLWFFAASQFWTWDGESASAESLTGIGFGSLKDPRILAAPYGVFVTATVNGASTAWVSDGAAAGTQQLYSNVGGTPPDAVTLGDFTYYARTGVWRTSGPLGVTELIAPTTSYADGSLAVVGDRLFYVDAYKLYSTDGSPTGTHAVPGGEKTELWFNVIGDQVFFSARSPTYDREPWRADASGASLIRDIRTQTFGSSPRRLTPAGKGIAFAAQSTRIYLSDGESVASVAPLRVDIKSVRPIVQHNGALYVSGGVPTSSFLTELYRIDAEGPVQITALVPGGSVSPPDWLTSTDDGLYFSARGLAEDGQYVHGVWRTDGVSGSTQLVWSGGYAPRSLPSNLVVNGDSLYFFSSNGLYRTYLASKVTELVKQFDRSDSNELALSNGTLFLFGSAGPYVRELWSSDGTAAGTTRLIQLQTSSPYSAAERPVVSGGQLIFANVPPTGPSQLVRYVGPGLPLETLVTLPNQIFIFADVGGVLYFHFSDPEHGRELWKLDPTTGQPVIVADINPGPASSNPRDITVVDGRLYVVATTPEYGEEVWVADIAPPGDFNRDLVVDAADYTVWRDRQGSAEDYQLWRDNFGRVGGLDALPTPPEPEPALAGGKEEGGTAEGDSGAAYFRSPAQTRVAVRPAFRPPVASAAEQDLALLELLEAATLPAGRPAGRPEWQIGGEDAPQTDDLDAAWIEWPGTDLASGRQIA